MNPGTVLLLGLLVLVYLNFMARRRVQRDRTALLERLVPGAQVVTTSGMHATVTEVADDGTVALQTAPGQVTRWEKLAMGRIISSPADAVTEDVPGDAAEPAALPVHPVVEPVAESRPDTAPPDRA